MQIQTSFTSDTEKQIKPQSVNSLRKKYNSSWKPFPYNSAGTGVITCCIGIDIFPSPCHCVSTYLSYTWNCNTDFLYQFINSTSFMYLKSGEPNMHLKFFLLPIYA